MSTISHSTTMLQKDTACDYCVGLSPRSPVGGRMLSDPPAGGKHLGLTYKPRADL